MIESLFILLFVVAFIFMILSLEDENILYGIFSISIFLILSISVFNIHYLVPVSVESDGKIIYSERIATSASPISLLFLLFAIIMIIWVFIISFDLSSKIRKRWR